jgi:16S rRNA C967 or C1407 C5-methylase (RsmB/RsmF family)
VTLKENTENVKYLLKQSGIEALPVLKYLPEGIEAKQEEDNFIQILPGEYDSDGFFISLYINTLGTK